MKETGRARDGEGNLGERGRRAALAAGGAAALLAAIGALADIGIGVATGGTSALPPDAAGRFAELAARPLLGLYRLDLLNLGTVLLALPVLYASRIALGREGAASDLALVFGLLGAAVFAANNAALPMLGLARDYLAADPSRRAALAAAGEALLAKGAHGSLGALPGFLLSSFASILLAVSMLGSRAFPRGTGLFGLGGNLLLLAYLAIVAIRPQALNQAMLLAAPGGILALAWQVLVGLGLLREARLAGPG